MRIYDIPSISIHILRDDKVEYSAAYGLADILQNTPATTKHRYRIASVSKLITAMAIGELLAEHDNIDLLTQVFGENGILSDVCSPCHPYLLHVRIIHLLEHSSGAWPHTSKIEFDLMEQNQTEFLMRVVQQEFPILFPGGRHMYSNIGYILLGRIIAKVSGKSYEEYANEKILKPLGINATIGKEGNSNIEVRRCLRKKMFEIPGNLLLPRQCERLHFLEHTASEFCSWMGHDCRRRHQDIQSSGAV